MTRLISHFHLKNGVKVIFIKTQNKEWSLLDELHLVLNLYI